MNLGPRFRARALWSLFLSLGLAALLVSPSPNPDRAHSPSPACARNPASRQEPMVSTAIAHYVYVFAHPFFSDHIQLKYAQTETVSSLDEIQMGALLAAPSEVVAVVAAWRNPDPTGAVEANNLSVGEDGTVTLYEKRGASLRLTHVDAGAGAYRPGFFAFFRPDDRPPVSLEETIWPRAIAEGGIRAFPAPERPWDIGTPARLAAFERRLSEKAALTA